jgi:hypothetical protein
VYLELQNSYQDELNQYGKFMKFSKTSLVIQRSSSVVWVA